MPRFPQSSIDASGLSLVGRGLRRWNGWQGTSALIALISIWMLPFCVSCMDGEATPSETPPATSIQSKNAPFAGLKVINESEDIDLGEGEFLVAFLNTTCEHCQSWVETLNELALIPEYPKVIGLMLGDESTLKEFRDLTKPEFPTVLIDTAVFFQFIGDAPPRLTLVRDGGQVKFWDEEQLTIDDVVKTVGTRQ